jgi:hypothetical protein
MIRQKPNGNEYLNFGQALELLKQGMFIYHVPGSEFIFNIPVHGVGAP